MHRTLLLLGLTLALSPAWSPAAEGASASGAYAVLQGVSAEPRPGCRLVRAGGELRAALYSAETMACPVARVGGDEVALQELAEALAVAHTAKGSKAGRGETARGLDFAPALDRIVDVRLLVIEARDMGLTELPDFRQAVETFRASTLRTLLQAQASAQARADPAEVERLVRAAVKQWKVRSAMFEQEEDARAFRQAVGKGGSFDALARAAVAAGKARGGEPGFVGKKEMLPELALAADALQVGQVSQPVKVATGWVVLVLEGVRYPEDPKVREQARAQSLAEQQHQAVRRFHQALAKKHARIDAGLLDGLDFEAGGEEGFKLLAKDPRVLVQIPGEPDVTVAMLAAEITGKFFHGVAEPIKEHRVNPYKAEAFEVLLGARLFAREARQRKLDQSPVYRRKLEEYERVLAFNTFLQRVVLPEVKVTEEEVRARYERRREEFTTPRMFRLEGLAFTSAKAAQAAQEQLRGGADFEWLRANAEGQLPPEARQLRFGGALLSASGLPPSLVKALSGAQPGEFRRYASDDGTQHDLLRVAEEVAPGLRPYAEVREPLAREVESDKVSAAVRDYAAKLRKVQRVELLITRLVG
jgi:hypothetical protein